MLRFGPICLESTFEVAKPNFIRNWHQTAIELLVADTDLILASIASDALILRPSAPDTLDRLVQHTQNLYESLHAQRRKLNLSASEAIALEEKLDLLRARLRSLGEGI